MKLICDKRVKELTIQFGEEELDEALYIVEIIIKFIPKGNKKAIKDLGIVVAEIERLIGVRYAS